MRKDDIAINEAYNQIIHQNPLEEGILDRAAAKTAGFIGGLQPKKRLVGAAASALGKLASPISKNISSGLQQIGAEQRREVAAAGNIAKITSVLKIQKTKIEKLALDIVNDLNKLGLNSKGITPAQVSTSLYNDVESMLTGNLAKSANVATQSTSTSSKPSGKASKQIDGSDVTGDPNDFDYYQKYNNGWFRRSGVSDLKKGGYQYTQVTDSNLVKKLDSLS
jgi:hypothetical protein